MKNKILGVTAIIALFALATLNVSITNTEANNIDLEFIRNQAFADGEYAGWSNFWQGQGFYKDEREIIEQCPIFQSNSGSGGASYGGASASGSGSGTQVNPGGRHDIRCGTGSSNCTPVDC